MRKAIAQNELNIGGITLKCAILDDGSRVFEADSFQNFMDSFLGTDKRLTEDEIEKLNNFCNGKIV